MMMGPLLVEELTEDDIVTIACSNTVMPPPILLINRNTAQELNNCLLHWLRPRTGQFSLSARASSLQSVSCEYKHIMMSEPFAKRS